MSAEKFKELMEGTIHRVKENASLGNILKDIGAELKQQAAHGAHELAAALFNGSAFVMYPRHGKEDPQHGPSHEAQGQPQQEEQQQEQSRGGMSR